MDVPRSYAEGRERFFRSHRVLFLYPEIASSSSFSFSSKHLGASYIRAFLQSQQIPTSQFTRQEPLSLPELVEQLVQEDPAVLCASVYDCTYHTVKMVVQELTARKPQLQVILGGPTPTFSAEVILRDFPEADVCVRGEGEITLYEVLDAFYAGRDLSGIQGVTIRGKNGEVLRNPDRDLIRGERRGAELDVLPSPYLEGIISPSEAAGVGIITARGCVFKCVYCNFSAMSRWTIRFHSVERVLDELTYIAGSQEQDGKLSVAIQDDAFTLDRQRAKEICRRIIDSGLELQIDCETRADTVDGELLELMRDAGFRDLHFGVESGSPKVLREIKKARSVSTDGDGLEPEKRFLQKVRESVGAAVKLDLKPTVSIILGLPNETRKQGLQSVKFVDALDDCRYYHNFLEIFAGTELFETHDRYGIGLQEVYREAVNRLYKTVYTYDVSSVPLIEERSLIDTGLQSAEMAARLCGDPFLFGQLPDARHPSLVVFTNALFPNLSSIEWFLNTAGSDTRLAFLWDMRSDPRNAQTVSFYEMHMPIQMLYWLRDRHPDGRETTFYEAAFSGNAENLTPYDFRMLDINSYDVEMDASKSEIDDIQHILQIEAKPGIGYFREIRKLLYLRDLLYTSRVANLNFLDVCRWSPSPCPASAMKRVVVDSNRDLYPCLSGRPVGRVGEDLDYVRDRTTRLAARVQLIRGCARCPVEPFCSKCLFPYPMGANEFCRAQRTNLASYVR